MSSFFPLNSLKFRKLQSLTDTTSHSAKQFFVFWQFVSIVLFTEQLKYWHRKLKFLWFFFFPIAFMIPASLPFIIFKGKDLAYFIPLHVLTSTTYTVSTNKVFLKLYDWPLIVSTSNFFCYPMLNFWNIFMLIHIDYPCLKCQLYHMSNSCIFLDFTSYIDLTSYLDLTSCILLNNLFWSTDILSPTLKPCYFNCNIINVNIWKALFLSHNCLGHS